MALFPIKYFRSWGTGTGYQSLAIKAVAGLSEDDLRIKLNWSFRKVENLDSDVKLFADTVQKEVNQVWKKPSTFSRYSPDWELIKKIGKEIDVDLAVLIFLRVQNMSELDVYLYDYKRDKVYARTNRSMSYSDISGGVRGELQAAIKEYFKEQ